MDAKFASELLDRRNRVRAHLGDGALVLFSAPVHLRNSDVEHDYRQHSDFLYLSGVAEPESALVLLPGEQYILFVREKNREREIWEGRRAGTEGALKMYGATKSHPITELKERLADYLEDIPQVHYLLAEQREWDHLILDTLSAIATRRRKRVTPPRQLCDARVFLHEMRLIKSAYEVEQMRNVASVSAQAHRAAMRACRAQMTEWQLQDVVENTFRSAGARQLAYESIVGSGQNATILHYRENTRTMQEGELVLIDAGAEHQYYAADITRTFPVSGRFSEVQRRIYQAVLDAQLAAIEASRVGSTLDLVHEAAVAVLTDALVKEGLLESVDMADAEAVKKRVSEFYMHRTSHFLGMDVHDVGSYFDGKEHRKLQSGMYITVEPGLYFAVDDESVPEALRGIGVRIEDDVLITEQGPIVLTQDAPKSVADVERECSLPYRDSFGS